MKQRVLRSAYGVSALVAMAVSNALAQTAPAGADESDNGGLQEIIVTAQKRQESAQTVPMSITAVSSDQLQANGVNEVRDLERLVTGFHYTEGQFAAPVYSMRGVGDNDSTLGSRPNVSVYVDEVPLPFAILTRGASLDVQRVEALKGPQGTLFGQNNTGGAINYIAAKPTDDFKFGVDATAANYATGNLGGFVSGPIAANTDARLSFVADRGGAWQESVSRGDRIGATDFTQARLQILSKPLDPLTIHASFEIWGDRSDTQQPAFLAWTPQTPAFANAGNLPLIAATPTAPNSDTAADWPAGFDYGRNTLFLWGSLRADYKLTDDINLTSISSLINHREEHYSEYTGSPIRSGSIGDHGRIHSFSQELRLTGQYQDKLKYLGGLSYEHSGVSQNDFGYTDTTSSYSLTPAFFNYGNKTDQLFKSEAAFLNLDYNLVSTLKVSGGARYTKTTDDFSGCSYTRVDDNLGLGLAPIYSFLRSTLTPPLGPVAIPLGACNTVVDNNFTPGLVVNSLDEHNISWRGGVDWQPTPDTLVYGNVSKGYKAGNFPIVSALSYIQFAPVKQESLLAYEIGGKATLFGRHLQITGAVFDYDYENKQVAGYTVPIFPFGSLNGLANVPKSRIVGQEIQAAWLAVRGLRFDLGATHLNSRIVGAFENYNPFGVPTNFSGQALPLTPTWQITAGGEYKWPVNDSLNVVTGVSANYRSRTNSALGALDLFQISPYTLIDAHAGVETEDGKWRLDAWGHNITDRYYWTSVFRGADTTVRFTGRPATYGLTLNYRF